VVVGINPASYTRLFLTVKKSSSDRVGKRSRSDRVLVE